VGPGEVQLPGEENLWSLSGHRATKLALKLDVAQGIKSQERRLLINRFPAADQATFAVS
jgi:hypothetical protein